MVVLSVGSVWLVVLVMVVVWFNIVSLVVFISWIIGVETAGR